MPSSFLKELDRQYIEEFDHARFMKQDLSAEDSVDYFAMLKQQLLEG